jgi:type II secretory pathway predicted ATPase ExeA
MDKLNTANTLLEQPNEFGKRLRAFREKHKLSLSDFQSDSGERTELLRKLRLFAGSKKAPRRMIRFTSEAADEMEEFFSEWLRNKKGYSEQEIFNELDQLFNLQENEMIQNRKSLTSAAIKFFNLKHDPFDVDRIPGEDEIFTNQELDEICRQVIDAVLYKKWIFISGPVGSGKTALKIRVARELAAWSKRTKQDTHLIVPEFFDMNAVGVPAIASYILEEFDVKVPNNKLQRVKKIKQLLTSLSQAEARVALLFDEGHRLNSRVYLALKNFWEMTDGAFSRLLGVVMFGQPQFVNATLRDIQFREITERVNVINMPQLDKSARDFLAHKIAAAGGDIDQLFEPDAVKRICAVAKTPLALGNITNNALMEAFEIEMPQVASKMLKLPDVPGVRNIRQAA